ncbi:unnamed protein product [Darwinula stevensoni]|uniref:UDP-glucose:glycoprotein glucosyltransferase n=2 Tax=Darwinula stevensoni TaxID=69355 RepID=A0A7R8XFB5_9CRUS|nr:unnamed protein product [Darwinula stevensoni]CAG0894843.1 unnamed protein product [Darwinula stevensoni]
MGSRSWTTLQALTVLLLLGHSRVWCKKHKWVSASVDARWQSTPWLLEASEFLHDERPDLFWRFADALADLDPESLQLSERSTNAIVNRATVSRHTETDKEYFETVVGLARRFLNSETKARLLKHALSLRYHSPRVEMFHQIGLQLWPDAKETQDPCSAFVDVHGRRTCRPVDVKPLLENAGMRNASVLYQTDHHYPGGEGRPTKVILYAEMGSQAFRDFHPVLKDLASSGQVDYVLRHFLPERDPGKTRLTGYGVELQLKSTEYKATDDSKVADDSNADGDQEDLGDDEVDGYIFSKLKALHPGEVEALEKWREHLLQSALEIPPLKVWELQDLSLQAVTRIMAAASPEEGLAALVDLSQNLPVQTSHLVKTKVDPELKAEIKRNQKTLEESLSLGAGEASLRLNGILLDVDALEVFALLDILRSEEKRMHALFQLGMKEPSQLQEMLQGNFQEKSGLSQLTSYAIDIRDSAVSFINDIETDKQFRHLPRSLDELLRPSLMGMARTVRRNVYHLVRLDPFMFRKLSKKMTFHLFSDPPPMISEFFMILQGDEVLVIDPGSRDSLFPLEMMDFLTSTGLPIRIGLVLSPAVDPAADPSGMEHGGLAAMTAFNYAVQHNKPYIGLSLLIKALKKSSDRLEAKDVHEVFQKEFKGVSLEEVFSEDSSYDFGRQLAAEFREKCGFITLPQMLFNGVPMDEKYLGSQDLFEEGLMTEFRTNMVLIQKAVFDGSLKEPMEPLDFLMSLPHVVPRLNRRILETEGQVYLDLMGELAADFEVDPEAFAQLTEREKTAFTMARMRYLRSSNSHPLSYWLVGDFDSPEGLALLYNALEFLNEDDQVRLGLVFNPEHDNRLGISRSILAALGSQDNGVATTMLRRLSDPDNVKRLLSGDLDPASLLPKAGDPEKYKEAEERLKSNSNVFKIHSNYASHVLRFLPGQMGLIANGRVLGPLNPDETFRDQDFRLLEQVLLQSIVQVLQSRLGQMGLLRVMRATAILAPSSDSRVRHQAPPVSDKHSVLRLSSEVEGEPSYDIEVVLDPLSRGAQKLAPLLVVLLNVVPARLSIIFNCVLQHSEIPLKSFYRLVLEAEPKFAEDGGHVAPVGFFPSLPHSPILTMSLDCPENWLTEVVKSPYDLDNIQLEAVTSGVYAEYELEYLLLEGHCFESPSGNPPRGLQLTLGPLGEDIATVDTIVMANLGYLQLKANAGAWQLRIRQGRSRDLFQISSHEGTDSPPGASEVHVLMGSLRSRVIKLRVAKLPGKENEKLLVEDDDQAESGFWGSLSKPGWFPLVVNASLPLLGDLVDQVQVIARFLRESLVGGGKEGEGEEEKVETINIFSIASGHLYERFLRIMMLSVLKHTKSPVKFWFLKNVLSPTFKDFLPYMAKEYGFEYELVQYKWPRWLHQQTEKQRIIWGYKILFLDVLFPLDIKKIIFVDADQVVRTDMKELMDLPLNGAPYGYTPFCDSRTDMDGFRFWKSGYWASHLMGRKYHISALYVVDLRQFRRLAAGDRLRGQYQGLSRDPNSLSNLDQDLPNNMMHSVAIKSLPQEWLWCETWCDDASKQYAKTIDLVSRPHLLDNVTIVKIGDGDEECQIYQEGDLLINDHFTFHYIWWNSGTSDGIISPQCNNPKTKEAKLTAAMRIIPEWRDYDGEIKALMEKYLKERELPAAPSTKAQPGSVSHDHSEL